jgi:hypothetical protein
MERAMRGLAVALVLSGLVATAARAAPADYPTDALAEYVFACMAANGQTPDMLRRCSCSIDHVASRLSYDEYVKAETVLAIQQVRGGVDRIVMFRTAPWAQAMVDRLRQAQVEAELRCF